MPKDMSEIDTNNVDVAAVYIGFTALVGDVERTALAFNLTPRVVRHLAEKFDWNDKIRSISMLNKSGKPGDWEKAQNRALSWVQGHMLRSVLQRILENINNMTREDVVRTVINQKRTGEVTFSASFYTDLAAAMEKCHSMCYTALSDSGGDRSRAEKEAVSPEMTMDALHSAMALALNSPVGAGAERVLLEEATEKAVKAAVPKRPEED